MVDSPVVRPPVLYKYCPPERADMLKSRQIAFSSRLALNDIFEMRALVDLQYPGTTTSREDDDRIVSGALENIIVLCLSDAWDNIPMWSYYAGAHTGFVIGLDSAPEFCSNLGPVTYSLDYPVVDFESGFNRPIFHKSEQWKHEREWRSFRMLAFNGKEYSHPENNHDVYLDHFSPDLVREVFLGHRMTADTRRTLCASLCTPEYQHVCVYEAAPDDHAWRLVRRPVKW
jgi:hypothetical protein